MRGMNREESEQRLPAVLAIWVGMEERVYSSGDSCGTPCSESDLSVFIYDTRRNHKASIDMVESSGLL